MKFGSRSRGRSDGVSVDSVLRRMVVPQSAYNSAPFGSGYSVVWPILSN
jgi:hypothetical protein